MNSIPLIKDSCGTIFSPDRKYRYTLWREWGLLFPGYCVFIGLNPSSADEIIDDPTISRCKGFAMKWGFRAMYMLNLFAYRATQPWMMLKAENPVGIENDRWIKTITERADQIILAWGKGGVLIDRDKEVLKMLSGRKLFCLGLTQSGDPRHPLYLPKTTKPILYPGKE